MKRITVSNKSDRIVERAGMVFAPGSERTVSVGEVQYRELSAAIHLSVYPEKAAETVEKAVTKTEEGGERGEQTTPETPSPEAESPAETPSQEEPQREAETKPFEQLAAQAEEDGGQCPYCSYAAKTNGGLQTHIRFKHPEKQG